MCTTQRHHLHRAGPVLCCGVVQHNRSSGCEAATCIQASVREDRNIPLHVLDELTAVSTDTQERGLFFYSAYTLRIDALQLTRLHCLWQRIPEEMRAAGFCRVPAAAAPFTTPARPHAVALYQAKVLQPVKLNLRATAAFASPEAAEALVPFGDAEKVPVFVDGQINKFPLQSGVFAVYDKEDVLRFVGISRNISLSITEHSKSLGDRVHSVKSGILPNATKQALTDAWKEWLQAAVRQQHLFVVIVC